MKATHYFRSPEEIELLIEKIQELAKPLIEQRIDILVEELSQGRTFGPFRIKPVLEIMGITPEDAKRLLINNDYSTHKGIRQRVCSNGYVWSPASFRNDEHTAWSRLRRLQVDVNMILNNLDSILVTANQTYDKSKDPLYSVTFNSDELYTLRRIGY